MSDTTLSDLQDFSLADVETNDKFDLSTMSQGELLALRAKIDGKLTGLSLSEVNLVKETLLQFQTAKSLQADANESGSDVPMNQRAQVQNSIANILTSLAKVQMELYDSERLKRLQAAVIKTVKKLPKEAQDTFFEALERDLNEAASEIEGM